MPWSYSSLKLFEQCPRKYFHLRIERDVKDQMGPEAQAGVVIHKSAEDYVNGAVPKLPKETEHYTPLLDRVRALPGKHLVESKMGLTQDLKPTGFFSDDVWYRGVIDFCAVNGKHATVIDYKTGKIRNDFDQLNMFAATVFATYENVDTINAGYLWLKFRKATNRKYRRDEVPGLWANVLPRVTRMEQQIELEKFPPNPTPLCGWCPVKKCKHWVQR